jgi:phosphoadenosine phosphosulfate reductase
MNHNLQANIRDLSDQINGQSIPGALRHLQAAFPGRVTFSTSFSMEDQLLSHLILSNEIDVRIFTLDTGRLFAETYSVWSRTNELYGTKIQAYFPDRSLLEEYLDQEGPNGFYASVSSRKQCCHIRKVEPLKRALQGQSVWVTGLRAEHSNERRALPVLDWDEINQIIKYNPLVDWTSEEVRAYIHQHDVPYNSLHDKGFVSIGCAPCTRAIQPGEDFRAGRWWWEENTKKECGLHAK